MNIKRVNFPIENLWFCLWPGENLSGSFSSLSHVKMQIRFDRQNDFLFIQLDKVNQFPTLENLMMPRHRLWCCFTSWSAARSRDQRGPWNKPIYGRLRAKETYLKRPEYYSYIEKTNDFTYPFHLASPTHARYYQNHRAGWPTVKISVVVCTFIFTQI